jgi:hypothetical protein
MTTATPQLRVRRAPERARYDLASVDRVLDRGRVAHVAFVANGFSYCIPTLYARVGDRLVIHGSSASRMVRALTAGAPACVTVTILDERVRSAIEHPANYDSDRQRGGRDAHRRRITIPHRAPSSMYGPASSRSATASGSRSARRACERGSPCRRASAE